MPPSPFRTDHAPPVGTPEYLADDLRVVTAPNAGPMTFTGSRSYLLGRGAVALIDPGPDDAEHFAALLAALEPGERISHVFVTHAHLDHSGLAPRIAGHFDAEMLAFGDYLAGRTETMARIAEDRALGGGEGVDRAFRPDHALADGDVVSGPGWALEAIHTPGHMANHLCFASAAHGVLFSGDHVMGWATTLVSPPDGDLTRFMASLEKLRGRGEALFLPGHGAPLEEPQGMIAHQIGHRRRRERQILDGLGSGPATVEALVAEVYREVPSHLHPAAARNVLAHLIDLGERGLVAVEGRLGIGAVFRRR